MGLDVSHDCWRGGYGAFMRFRKKVAEVAGYGDVYGPIFSDKPINNPPAQADFDAGKPLMKFLWHSDCDGEIPHEECNELADALEGLLPALKRAGEGGGHIGSYEAKAKKFIKGLRDAAKAQENVEFC